MPDHDDLLGPSGPPPALPPTEPLPAPAPTSEGWQPDGQFRKLDPGYIPVESVGNWVFTAFCAAALLIGTALALALEWFSPPVLVVLALVEFLFLSLLVWFSISFPRLQYEHIRYAVSEAGIEIHRGIFWRRIVNVPRTRVQHTDVTQGPLARRFSIAMLHIYTAGTENNHILLNGLSHSDALRIRNYLVGEVVPDDV